MDSLTSEELAKVVELGQLLFEDLSYAMSVLNSVADEADRIRHRQTHRRWYDPWDKQRPHRWDMPPLTQYHIAYCWCFNDWMKAQEKEATEKKAKPPLTQQDFLRAYCVYLFGQTLYNGSAHVAITLGCHYWRYPPQHIGKLNVDLIRNPHRDYKRWKAQLQARFRTVDQDSRREVTKEEHNWVIDFLDLIAPTSQIHDPSEEALRRFLGDLERSQELCQTVRPLILFQGSERSQERSRLHVLLARCCGFVRLPPAYNAAVKRSIGWLLEPDAPTVQPCIPIVPGGENTDVDPNNPPGPWGLPVPPRPVDLTDLKKRFDEAQKERRQRRQQYRAGVLEIRVDGESMGKFDVQAAQPFQFDVPCDACRVQIYGQDEAGDLLLAVFPMAEVVPDTRGKTVTLQLTAARQADGTLAEELVELTYLPPGRVAAFTLGACGFQLVHRFGSGLARRVIAARQAVESASVRLAWQARQGLFAWWKRFWAGSVPEVDSNLPVESPWWDLMADIHMTEQEIEEETAKQVDKFIATLGVLVGSVLLAVAVFVSAGTMALPTLWAYLTLTTGFGIANIRAACDHIRPPPTSLRRGVVSKLLFVAVVLVAALDVGRFHWGGKLSTSTELVSLTLFALTQAVGTWAVRANFYYFCAPVLMQKQRGYRVITDGPYRYIRHPGYLAVLLGMLTAALGVGSWIALIPAVLFSSFLIWRTALEDRFLREHVPIYEDYATSVRYRLFPWVW